MFFASIDDVVVIEVEANQQGDICEHGVTASRWCTLGRCLPIEVGKIKQHDWENFRIHDYQVRRCAEVKRFPVRYYNSPTTRTFTI